MFDFLNKIVIVTGGTRGIGKAISEAFLRSGATVIVTYSSNDKKAEQFKKDNSKYSDRLELQKFDVANYKQVENFYTYIEEKYNSIDILINNAGIRKDSIVGTMAKEDWHAVLDINLTGSFYMCKFGVRNMIKKRYGRIINITSPSSHFGFKGQANYAASKAGLIGMTRSLAREVATRGITVNCVSPGFVSTDFINDLDEAILKEYQKMIPLKKFASPEEVAHGVLFLATSEASYITGSTLAIDGGL
ncbi:MAG: 3-oxoacyl-[acyl-carrier-protein] reductase [bacterium]